MTLENIFTPLYVSTDTLVERLPNQRPISCRFAFELNFGTSGLERPHS